MIPHHEVMPPPRETLTPQVTPSKNTTVTACQPFPPVRLKISRIGEVRVVERAEMSRRKQLWSPDWEFGIR